VVQFKDSKLTLSDEVAGQAGAVLIDGSQSLSIEDSEITSIGMNTIDAGVNGNDITMGSGAVTVKSSVINTTVLGTGEAGQITLVVTKSFSLADSWIGGAGDALGQVRPMDVATDGSWGAVAAVGGNVPLDASLGLVKGGNRFFSLASLSLFNGQQLSFANLGDSDQRVIARVTGGDTSDVSVLQGHRAGINPDIATGFAHRADSADDTPAGQVQAGGIDADIAAVAGQCCGAAAETHLAADNRQALAGFGRTGLAKRRTDDLHVAAFGGDEADRLGFGKRVGCCLQVHPAPAIELDRVAGKQRQLARLAELRVGANHEAAWVHQEQVGGIRPEINGTVQHRRLAAGHPRDHALVGVAKVRERKLLAVEQ
jgi:hypothetical protein